MQFFFLKKRKENYFPLNESKISKCSFLDIVFHWVTEIKGGISAGIFCLSVLGNDKNFAEPPQWRTVWSNGTGADILLASDWSNFQSDWFHLMPLCPAEVHRLRLTQERFSLCLPAPAHPVHRERHDNETSDPKVPLKEWAKLTAGCRPMWAARATNSTAGLWIKAAVP